MSFWRAVLIRASAIVAAVAVLFSVFVLARPIAILLASIIIAVALEPLVERLERWVPRGLAAVTVYATLVLVTLGILAVIGVAVADQVEQAVDQAPTNREELVDLVNKYDPFGDGRLVEFFQNNRPSGNGLFVQIPLQITSTLAEIVIAFFLSMYWVIAAPALRRFFLSLFPDDGKRQQSADVLDAMGQKMGGYVRAITLDGIILGVVTYVGLSLLGVRFPIVLAIISGLSVLVPIIGPIASAIPAVFIALIDSPIKAALVLAFYVAVQQIESNILLPKIMQREADIHPLLGVFAVFAGGSIGGILGALIAVPTAGAIQVLATDALAPAIRDSNRPGTPDIVQAGPPDQANQAGEDEG